MDLNEIWSDDPVTNQPIIFHEVGTEHYVTYQSITKMWHMTRVCIEV